MLRTLDKPCQDLKKYCSEFVINTNKKFFLHKAAQPDVLLINMILCDGNILVIAVIIESTKYAVINYLITANSLYCGKSINYEGISKVNI